MCWQWPGVSMVCYNVHTSYGFFNNSRAPSWCTFSIYTKKLGGVQEWHCCAFWSSIYDEAKPEGGFYAWWTIGNMSVKYISCLIQYFITFWWLFQVARQSIVPSATQMQAHSILYKLFPLQSPKRLTKWVNQYQMKRLNYRAINVIKYNIFIASTHWPFHSSSSPLVL